MGSSLIVGTSRLSEYPSQTSKLLHMPLIVVKAHTQLYTKKNAKPQAPNSFGAAT